MLEFKDFKKEFQKNMDLLCTSGKLFVTDVDKDILWETYLESFPEEANQIVNERREYDCNCCKHFIRNYGNIVVIKNNKLISIWDLNIGYPFDVVCVEMSKFVKSKPIKDVFVSKFSKLGTDKNRQLKEDGTLIVWNHLYFELPNNLVDKSSKSIGDIQGGFRDSKNVFARSMEELSLEAGETILELINQDSLYRGQEFKNVINEFIKFKNQFNKIAGENKDNWCWIKSFNNPIARIRNTAIGTLLIDLSNGVDLNVAVSKFEKVMAPTNYKRPKPIFTKKMVEEAQTKIQELGYEESLSRKHAILEDITVNNVLFVNRDAKKKIGGNVFDDLKDEATKTPKKFDKVEEIKIDDFINDILPTCESIELMVENKHQNNLMSLVAPEDNQAPSMFKWNNNFSWSYTGDITDSMKQNVKNAGGNVDGVLRFSIQWNEENDNQNDLDAHCLEPNGNLIYYGRKQNRSTGGNLDVDIIEPENRVAVENITWPSKHKMLEGRYQFIVHNYSNRNGRNGFRSEIEFDGQIYSFDYRKDMRQGETVLVADVLYSQKEGFKIKEHLDSSMSSKEIWGIKTNQFNKVSIMMFSPNYWDEQKGIGNKHYFFFLENCINDSSPRGFYNEFLKEELMKHKKVFEALSSKMRVDFSENQLSGLGFSSTQRNDILVKVSGKFTRMLKIKF